MGYNLKQNNLTVCTRDSALDRKFQKAWVELHGSVVT